MWNRSWCGFAAMAAANLFLCGAGRAQTAAGPVGCWTVVSGGVTHDYAFTQDGKFESKIYGTRVYQISYGTYSVQGDRLTLSSPQTSPETFRWKIVMDTGRPTLKLTDSFGATSPYYAERFDHRYVTATLIPYDRATLPAFWVVNHGNMRWEYAFTADGRFQSKRIGDAVNETVRGNYAVKGNILLLTSPQKPPQAFLWRMELENGGRTLILADVYGAFEVYYEAKAGE